VKTCGDGITVNGETCDDGNVIDGDGCSSKCFWEEGYKCLIYERPSKCFVDQNAPTPPIVVNNTNGKAPEKIKDHYNLILISLVIGSVSLCLGIFILVIILFFIICK